MSANQTEPRSAPAVDRVARVRGGVSLWAILSGVLIAYGALVALAAIIGSILAATGIAEGGIPAAQLEAATWGAIAGLIIMQFLAYLWGGYSAGRMARGTGWINGILVAVAAIIMAMLLGAMVVAGVGTPAGEILDPQTFQVPLGEAGILATGTGIGLLVAALLGGALGGNMGARWHTRLEDAELRQAEVR